MKKTVIAVVALIIVAGVIFGVWQFTRPDTKEGMKNVTVEVVHKDGSERTYEISTDHEYLADALLENNIVGDNQGTYGLYIIMADGETVDEAGEEWWCLSKDGESLTTSASETVISDGDTYEITFTVGYDY